MRNKLRYPEFVELINSYDLIGVQETKLDDADCLEIPGYTIVCHNRQTISRYRSGGTALIAKNSILPYLKLEKSNSKLIQWFSITTGPGRVAQSVGHLTRKSGVLGSIPGLATYFRFSFRFFKKGSCQLLAKVCARSTG